MFSAWALQITARLLLVSRHRRRTDDRTPVPCIRAWHNRIIGCADYGRARTRAIAALYDAKRKLPTTQHVGVGGRRQRARRKGRIPALDTAVSSGWLSQLLLHERAPRSGSNHAVSFCNLNFEIVTARSLSNTSGIHPGTTRSRNSASDRETAHRPDGRSRAESRAPENRAT
jgi:hypothetical protein